MLNVKDINVYFNKKHILKNVSFDVRKGEFFSLLGPSGSGKSTLLKTLCGLVEQNSGEIFLDEKNITGELPMNRGIVMVFQDMRLFPNMCVWENVAFPLKMKKVSKEKQRETAMKLLDEVSMMEHSEKKVTEISGGQQQRVAFARAIAGKPKYLLLDEPFSSLDEEAKEGVQELLYKLHKKRNIAVLLVTHDKKEALKMSDKIALIKEGEILQCGTPTELYENPVSYQAAAYFGEKNFVEGSLVAGIFKTKHLEIEMSGELEHDKEDTILAIPYDAIKIQKYNKGNYDFTVEETQYLGNKYLILLKKETLFLKIYSDEKWEEGETVDIKFDNKNLLLF